MSSVSDLKVVMLLSSGGCTLEQLHPGFWLSTPVLHDPTKNVAMTVNNITLLYRNA